MSDPLRMPDLNKFYGAGRLTRDPELKYLPNGMALCKMGLAISRKYKTKDGEQREEVLFINATCWGKTAEWAGENFHKGRPVMVEGRLKTDEWEDNDGNKRSAIEINVDKIQALDWEERGGDHAAKKTTPAPRPIEEPVTEDDIPF